MTLKQVYDRAGRLGIQIDEFHMRALRAVSISPGWIAIDSRKYDSLISFKCDLMHEVGHCETGSFYGLDAPRADRAKCEYRANKRAVSVLMPYRDVMRALRRGYVTAWQLAEYFDVTPEVAQMAVRLYGDRIQGIDEFERRSAG